MSADNCIAVGEFPTKGGGKEYRVIHAQAVENLDYGTQEMQDYTRVAYFGDATSFKGELEAMVEAERLAEEVINSAGVLEYGIQMFFFDRPLLNVSMEEADEWLRKKWDEPVESGEFLDESDYQLIEPPPLPKPKFSDLRSYPGMNGFSILNFKEKEEK